MAVAGSERMLGENAYVYVMQGSTPVLIACATKLSFDVNVSKETFLCQGSEGITGAKPGAKEYSFQIEGLNRKFSSSEEATNFGFDDFFDTINDGTEVTIKFEDSSAPGSIYTGVGHLQNLNTALEVMKNSTYSTSGWFNTLVKTAKPTT